MLVHNPFYDLATSNLYMVRNWRHALAQNFFERCLSKVHLFCFRMLYLYLLYEYTDLREVSG